MLARKPPIGAPPRPISVTSSFDCPTLRLFKVVIAFPPKPNCIAATATFNAVDDGGPYDASTTCRRPADGRRVADDAQYVACDGLRCRPRRLRQRWPADRRRQAGAKRASQGVVRIAQGRDANPQ